MKSRTWAVLLAAVVLVCALASIPLLSPGAAARARITSHGQVVAVVDLAVDRELTVTAPGGGTNTVTVKNGSIAVTAADCPDHYCMDRGYCTGGSQIVCLPNRLVITFLGEAEVDGVAG